MKSISKIELDAAILARLAEKHLGKTLVASRELTEGWFNTIHILELADGSKAVLKVSPPPSFTPMRYERDILAAEVAVHRLFAQKGIRGPKVLVDCPNGDELGHAWFMMEFLEGQAWFSLRKSQSQADCDRVDAEIARESALLNAIHGKRFGRWNEDHCSSPSWADSFLAMVEDVLADARDKSVSLPRSEADLRALFQSARAELDMVKTPCLVHWDLHDGNAIVNPNSLELMGFVDPDRALWGDPLMEFYFRPVDNISAAWKDAYRQACTASGTVHPLDMPGATRRAALYDIYLALVMVVEVAFRGYNADHDTWVRGICDKMLEAYDRS